MLSIKSNVDGKTRGGTTPVDRDGLGEKTREIFPKLLEDQNYFISIILQLIIFYQVNRYMNILSHITNNFCLKDTLKFKKIQNKLKITDGL